MTLLLNILSTYVEHVIVKIVGSLDPSEKNMENLVKKLGG